MIPTIAPIVVAGVVFLIAYRIRVRGGRGSTDDGPKAIDEHLAQSELLPSDRDEERQRPRR